jgi:pimeloyl-ACP methyl ester carboxylesterase
MRAPFVLVHGAWQTAATWDLVVPQLQKAGRRVFTAKLTGLEVAGPPLTEAVTLETHIQDVVRLMEVEDLHDVTLVGHSYGGMIVTGVAERARARMGRLVYVDAFVPNDGQAAMDLLPEPIQTLFREQARADGNGWRLRSSERQLNLWGLKKGPAREFVRARLCDFSLRCFTHAVTLSSRVAETRERTYIACVGEGYPARAVFDPFANRARSEGWRHHELPTGHDCHVEMPDEFSELLLRE